MNTWISLLRGINVGGNNILPMKDLRALLETQGFKSVRTYIQSGNCVFRSIENDYSVLEDHMSNCIEAEFGFRPSVLVMKKDKFDRAIAENPFAEFAEDPKSIHFSFLKEEVHNPDLSALQAIKSETEQFELVGNVFYLYAPDGIGRSKLAAQVENKLGVPATARNLRSVLKISDLAQ